MYCRYCGKEIEPDSSYCPYCGGKTSNRSSQLPVNSMTVIYALAYVPILFWLPLVWKNKTDFGRKVANQGLWLLILSVGLNVAFSILEVIFGVTIVFLPLSLTLDILSGLCGIGVVVLMVIGIVSAVQHRLFRIPIVGEIELIK